MAATTLRTERLLMRPWREADLEPFAALNSDPEVMEHFPGPLTAEETAAFVERIEERFVESGWGLWAVAMAGGSAHGVGAGRSAPFIGFVGLWPADHVQPGMVEVGWRLSRAAWGRGYAPEAATEALRFGFEDLELAEIVSFTVPQNVNSRRVMEKIGLRRRPDRDFDHPNVDPEHHPELVHHVLYSLDRRDWLS